MKPISMDDTFLFLLGEDSNEVERRQWWGNICKTCEF